jgi:hypothetical protein
MAFKIWGYALRSRRRGSDERTFVDLLRGYDPVVARTVYQVLSLYGPIKQFPILPGDRLTSTFGLADEDLEDVLMEITRAMDRKVCGPGVSRPIDTVQDLVSRVQDLPASPVNGI